jgi:adenine-specific DNA-methyltransferase
MLKINTKWDIESDLCLYQGDCLEFVASIPDSSIQLVCTSPPYNIGKAYEKKRPLADYIQWQEAIITECYRILNPHGSLCWQVGNYVDNGEIIPLDMVLFPIFSKLGMKLRNRIVWHFGHGLHASKRFSGRYEVILWFTKQDDYYFNLDAVRVPQKYPGKRHFKGDKKGQLSCNPLGKNPSDVWEIPNVKSNHVEKTLHPAQFPVELIERLVLSMTSVGDWTFDPFMGVGSTQIASIIHNRKSAGAELMPEYFETMIDRVHKAMEGTLLIRPMNRPVYSPDTKVSVPPTRIDLVTSPVKQLEIPLEIGNVK